MLLLDSRPAASENFCAPLVNDETVQTFNSKPNKNSTMPTDTDKEDEGVPEVASVSLEKNAKNERRKQSLSQKGQIEKSTNQLTVTENTVSDNDSIIKNAAKMSFATYVLMSHTSKLEKMILLLCAMIRPRSKSMFTFEKFLKVNAHFLRKKKKARLTGTRETDSPCTSQEEELQLMHNEIIVNASRCWTLEADAEIVKECVYQRFLRQATQAVIASLEVVPPINGKISRNNSPKSSSSETIEAKGKNNKKRKHLKVDFQKQSKRKRGQVICAFGGPSDGSGGQPPLSDELVNSGLFADCGNPEICRMLYKEDMNELVRNITREAKALVQAEICSLFLLDKEHSELVAEVFEKNGTSDEYLTEIRMPLNQGVVGHVATTGQMLNVKNVADPYFYKKVDEMTGFTTRNILCFPIKDEKNHLVGVAELCNKIGKKAFTRQDEQCAATFSVYCALSISHLQEAHRRSHMAAELLVQGSTLSIAPEDILRLTVRDIPSPSSFHRQFDQFSFVPRCIGTGDTYVEASLSMFKALGFIDKYRLRRRTLARFLLMVQKGYRDVPYHNWSHAFAVGHFCYLLIKIPAVMEALSDLERFALLVACLCHDIDHRGTTNAFQLQSKTPLAQLYSSEGSVLERHHFAQTVTILGMEECNIFDQLTRAQYQTVLDHIREIILATDIAAHLRKVQDIQEMVERYNSDSTEHRYLLTCLLMTASDLSDQSKDFENSKLIAENIYKEFFSQGDLEKQMGNEPNVMMDRDRACVPQIQLHFMDTVALPVFQYAARLLPELQSTYDSMLNNRVCWQELDKILREDGYVSGGLDYLHDAELERRVYERLSTQRGDDRGRVRVLAPRGLADAMPPTSATVKTPNSGEDSAQTSARSAASTRTWFTDATVSSSARTELEDQPTTSRDCRRAADSSLKG